jgi:dTDP-glucose 4,6-dehydratase
MFKCILVTGGCGFVGANYLNSHVPAHPETTFVNIDCLHYCADECNVLVRHLPNYTLYRRKIQDIDLSNVLRTHAVDAVIHLAGQTHVDNSFERPLDFTHDNVAATHLLLESCRAYGSLKRFVYVSTDEVYGESSAHATESAPLRPSTPYAASKAAADLLVQSYVASFAFPAIIVRPNNVYGNHQHPEKVIPKFISSLLNHEPCTIHGTGTHRRSFLHVSDLCSALHVVLQRGEPGHAYNVASSDEYNVLDLAKRLVLGVRKTRDYRGWIRFVPDRPVNDSRYLMDCDKIKRLGWKQEVPFDHGIIDTIRWFTQTGKKKISATTNGDQTTKRSV